MDSDSSDLDISIPSELLQRERELIERNKRLQDKLDNILVESNPEPEPAKAPKAEQKVIEVELPENVAPIEFRPVDPIPELKEAWDVLSGELQSVQEQLSMLNKDNNQRELEIAKGQAEYRKLCKENDTLGGQLDELQHQIEANQAKLGDIKSECNALRISRLDRIQRKAENTNKLDKLEAKLKKQKALVTHYNAVQAKLNAELSEPSSHKLEELQQRIAAVKQQNKKCLLVRTKAGALIQHLEKSYAHMKTNRRTPLSPEALLKLQLV